MELDSIFWRAGEVGEFLAGAGIVLLFGTLLLQRKAVRYQSFLHLHEYLSRPEFAAARRHVRTKLYKKTYAGGRWSSEDRDAANGVCATYDQAGFFLARKNRIIDKKMAKAFLRSSWGASVCDQYESLVPFLMDYQTPGKLGCEFFGHFADIYDEARKTWRPRSKCQHLVIISGGQTGADRAALDAAITLGLRYEGYCPLGGAAEDMLYKPGLRWHYPGLIETSSEDPNVRTRLNVDKGDATLILHDGRGYQQSSGTVKTKQFADTKAVKPKVVNVDDPDAVSQVINWGTGISGLEKLNVAGPRESEADGLYGKSRDLLLKALPIIVEHCARCAGR